MNAGAVDVFGLPLVHDFKAELWTIGKYTCVAAVGQLLALLVAPKEKKLATANLLLWLPIGPIYMYWVTTEVMTNCMGTLEERARNLSPAGLTATRTYVCLQNVGLVVELFIMIQKRDKWASQLPIIGHHIVSSLGCLLTLYYCRLISCCCSFQLVEMSTVFLNLLLFTKIPAYKPWVQKNIPWLTTFSGVALWMTFVFFRLLLCPIIMLRWIMDHSSGHPIVKDVTWLEILFLLFVALTVWVLSMKWFEKIHKGFMKEMRKVFVSKNDGGEAKIE